MMNGAAHSMRDALAEFAKQQQIAL
jgi:hypothetical protein